MLRRKKNISRTTAITKAINFQNKALHIKPIINRSKYMPFTIFSITIFSIDIVKDKNIGFYGNINRWIL